MMTVFELNMDGLVGPTHHYAGLSAGNIASTNNALQPSNPRAAAKQGLAKMRLLHEMGLKQGFLLPHQRPNLELLHQLGFSGSPEEQIIKASKAAPELLSACYSASNMWTANAATVSASSDTDDKRVHFTAANLVTNLHRHQEAAFSKHMLQAIFADDRHFAHHSILPRSSVTGDEGAANYNRLCQTHAHAGIHVFVYGKQALGAGAQNPSPTRYPARQTKEAFQAIARSHQLDPARTIFACQNPAAIDQGVFHNDVISVANESVFLVHQEAFYAQDELLNTLNAAADFPLTIIQVPSQRISVQTAVDTYFFNSQLISVPNTQDMMLIAPSECEFHSEVKAYIDELIQADTNPIRSVQFLDLKQSMRNGGGPACLRLRIPMKEQELAAMQQTVLVSEELLARLEQWVDTHYRSELVIQDLADPQLMYENLRALDELTQIVQLGSLYSFQR